MYIYYIIKNIKEQLWYVFVRASWCLYGLDREERQ